MPSLIPLDLYGEVTTATGARYKWDANQEPGSRPTNLSFRTKIGEGFSDASLQLARRIDQDYPDLNLVNTITFTGADGTTAYEGRNSAMPHDLGDSHSIGVTLAGWMAHGKDRKFRDIIVDRDAGSWGGMSLAERSRIALASQDFASLSWATDGQGLVCAFPNQALGAQVITEAWYRAPQGVTIAKVGYVGAETTIPAGYDVARIYYSSTDDLTGVGAPIALTMNGAVQTATAATAQRYVTALVYSNGTAATPAAGSSRRFSKLAAYSDHGLTIYTGETGEPGGVYASDVMRYLAGRWCPQLDTSGVQDTNYVIQHLAWPNSTTPYDAWLELNKYHLWRLEVWENKRLDFGPYNLEDYDWEIRTDDPGTTFSSQGQTTENLFNGIDVTYTDPLTGTVGVLSASDYTDLRDTSLSNPWNQHGIDKFDDITLSSPTLAASALNLGAAALADRNRPKTPGTITVRGYIRDRSGNPQPAWKVRAGQTISITNFPNDTPRLIVETDYNDEDKTVRLAIDRPFALLDAYLDRQQNALQARGLA